LGIESFYFSVKLNQECNRKRVLDFIKQNFSVEPYSMPSSNIIFKKKVIDKNRYYVDNCLVVSIKSNDNDLVITLEACFANFDEVMKRVYNFLNLLKIEFKNVIIFRNDNLYNDEFDLSWLIVWIMKLYGSKYINFTNQYGVISKFVSPAYFFEYINKAQQYHYID